MMASTAPGSAGLDSPAHGRAASGPTLSPAALALRFAHTAIAGMFLLSIAYVWWCALTGRRGRLLSVAVTALIGEGALVAVNRGDCPLARLQDRVGDPVPLFELLLPPPAARRAVPVLGGMTAAGLGLLARNRRNFRRNPPCLDAR